MNVFKTYTYVYFKYLIFGRKMDMLISFFRERGVVIGDNCSIYSSICTPEPYLITIKNNVTISTKVQFITHDNSVCKVFFNTTDVFGRICIGNNCFIGSSSVVLPGVELGDNCIVAAGSIVTKSFKGNCIVAGNPAKIISSILQYKAKSESYCFNTNGLTFEEKKALILSLPMKLIRK